jgi:hypothetical protein
MARQPDAVARNAFKEAGMLKNSRRIAAILLLGVLVLMNVLTVLGDDTPGNIHGIVFIDEDGDGEYDPGEPVLEGVTVELTNGEITLAVMTDGDGFFVFSVEPGVWQGVIYPPQGYVVINDATREVVIESEGSLEAVLDFGLIPETISEQGGAGNVDTPQEVEVESESTQSAPGGEVETDFYDGESPVLEVVQGENTVQDDSQVGSQGMILPESGFPVPLKWILVILVVVILVGGASLIFLGRRLQR